MNSEQRRRLLTDPIAQESLDRMDSYLRRGRSLSVDRISNWAVNVADANPANQRDSVLVGMVEAAATLQWLGSKSGLMTGQDQAILAEMSSRIFSRFMRESYSNVELAKFLTEAKGA